MTSRIRSELTKFLLVPRLRSYFCRARWLLRKRRLRFFAEPTAGVGENVIKYNLTAFDEIAGFGCGGRMNLVMYPLSALITEPARAKVLIVGPRTEDDIYLAKALGLPNARGLDLFSYSPHIDLGDMHKLPYPSEEFDAVVLGWVIAYSSDPATAFGECKRVLKKNGFLAIGWEWVPERDRKTNTHIRGNPVNEFEEMSQLAGYPPVFIHNPAIDANHHKAAIFKK